MSQYSSKNEQYQWIKLVENSILIQKKSHKQFLPISSRDEVEAISIDYQNYIIDSIEKEQKYIKIINQICKQLDIKNNKINGSSPQNLKVLPLQHDFEQQLLQIQFITKDLYDQIILLNKKIDYMEIQLNSKEPKYLRSSFNSNNNNEGGSADINGINEQIKRLAKVLDIEPKTTISSTREDLGQVLEQVENKIRDIKDINNIRIESFALIQQSIQSLNEMCQEFQKTEFISVPLINSFSSLNENLQQLLEIQVKNSGNPRQYASMFNIIQKQSINLSNTLKNALNSSIQENKEVIQMRNEELLEEVKQKSKEVTQIQLLVRESSNKILADLQILLRNQQQDTSILQLIESVQNQLHALKQKVLITNSNQSDHQQEQSEQILILEAENKVLNDKYDNQKEVLQQLEEKIYYLNRQVESLKEQILQLEKENEFFKEENETANKEKELFKQEMEMNLENLINTKNQYEIIMETDKQSLYQRIDELRQENINLQELKVAKERECQELSETIDDLEEFSKKQLTHIKNFQDQNAELLNRVAQFDSKVLNLVEEIDQYKKIIERQQKDMERMQTDVTKLVTTCEQQQEELMKQKQSTNSNSQQLTEQMKKYEEQHQKLITAQQESEQLKQKHSEMDEKYQKMQQLLSITQNELKNARQNQEKQQIKQNEAEDLRNLIDSLQNDIRTATLNQQLFEEQRNQKLKENQLLKEQNQQLQQEVHTMREQITQSKRLSTSSTTSDISNPNKQYLIIESLKAQIKYKDQQFEKERAMFRSEEDNKLQRIQMLESIIKQLQSGQQINGLQIHEEPPINGNTANFNSSLNMYYENLLETKDLEINHLRNLIKQFSLENSN